MAWARFMQQRDELTDRRYPLYSRLRLSDSTVRVYDDSLWGSNVGIDQGARGQTPENTMTNVPYDCALQQESYLPRCTRTKFFFLVFTFIFFYFVYE